MPGNLRSAFSLPVFGKETAEVEVVRVPETPLGRLGFIFYFCDLTGRFIVFPADWNGEMAATVYLGDTISVCAW